MEANSKNSILMPALMPANLRHLEHMRSEDDLYEHLIKRMDELTLFLETACSDETWCGRHSSLMDRLLDWLTTQYFLGNYPRDFSVRVAQAIQPHYSVLEHELPKWLTIELKDATLEVNPLLFGASSRYFEELIANLCREKQIRSLKLSDGTFNLFQPTLEFINTGTVKDIWKKNKNELLTLLRYNSHWEVIPLAELCQQTLKRYVDVENAVELLLLSHEQRWTVLRHACYEVINKSFPDVLFHESSSDLMIFEFHRFTDAAMKLFKAVNTQITGLIVSGNLTEDEHFSQTVRACPKLLTLDVTDSASFSDEFLELPKELNALKLAQCPWLSNALFKKIVEITPYLKELSLASNPQLTSETWAWIAKLKNLKILDLSHCHQIGDNEFKLISKSFPNGTDLAINECRKITDRAFFEFARTNARFVTLDLSRCSIGDSGLIEIGLHFQALTHLNLTRCELVTEKGVMELVKHAPSLTELTLTHTNVSRDAIQEMHLMKPYLKIIV